MKFNTFLTIGNHWKNQTFCLSKQKKQSFVEVKVEAFFQGLLFSVKPFFRVKIIALNI